VAQEEASVRSQVQIPAPLKKSIGKVVRVKLPNHLETYECSRQSNQIFRKVSSCLKHFKKCLDFKMLASVLEMIQRTEKYNSRLPRQLLLTDIIRVKADEEELGTHCTVHAPPPNVLTFLRS
jgi:hypothetical protein